MARSRRTDPLTSHEAGSKHERDGVSERNRRLCLATVTMQPGMTTAEIALIAGLDYHEAARRLPELRPMHVLNGAARECSVNKTRAMTWIPVIEKMPPAPPTVQDSRPAGDDLFAGQDAPATKWGRE